MIFGMLNTEKILHENLTHLSTSPIRCSYFTLGNPKMSFSAVIFINTEKSPGLSHGVMQHSRWNESAEKHVCGANIVEYVYEYVYVTYNTSILAVIQAK